jgi:hypothetical protein
MKYNLVFLFILSSFQLFAQNVGVGTTTPVEKLDVNGNINVTGTIKANGVDGTANQVLMKNGSGALSWGDLSDYKNYEMFNETGVQPWIVPAGVTKIEVEIWGGGGGGSMYCGGGGGAYARGYFMVTPGATIYINVGAGGIGGPAPDQGGVSEVVSGLIGVGAFGGHPGGLSASFINIGDGGHGTASPGYRYYFSIPGAPGQLCTSKFISTTTGSNFEITEGGKGGDAGNTTNTGGTAAYRVIQTSSGMAVRNGIGESGRVPGGGGGAGLTLLQTSATVTGQAGASGRVIIHY